MPPPAAMAAPQRRIRFTVDDSRRCGWSPTFTGTSCPHVRMGQRSRCRWRRSRPQVRRRSGNTARRSITNTAGSGSPEMPDQRQSCGHRCSAPSDPYRPRHVRSPAVPAGRRRARGRRHEEVFVTGDEAPLPSAGRSTLRRRKGGCTDHGRRGDGRRVANAGPCSWQRLGAQSRANGTHDGTRAPALEFEKTSRAKSISRWCDAAPGRAARGIRLLVGGLGRIASSTSRPTRTRRRCVILEITPRRRAVAEGDGAILPRPMEVGPGPDARGRQNPPPPPRTDGLSSRDLQNRRRLLYALLIGPLWSPLLAELPTTAPNGVFFSARYFSRPSSLVGEIYRLPADRSAALRLTNFAQLQDWWSSVGC